MLKESLLSTLDDFPHNNTRMEELKTLFFSYFIFFLWIRIGNMGDADATQLLQYSWTQNVATWHHT